VWVLALLALGLVMVYSASIALPDNPKFARYCADLLPERHLLALGIGFVARWWCCRCRSACGRRPRRGSSC
jgi:cell division protein FtsW